MGHKIINQNEMHYVTMTVVGWLDVFTRKEYRDIIIESLQFCVEKKGLRLFAYVIMSNHIHLIIKTENSTGLSALIRDFKRFTSKKILKTIIENQQESRREWMMRLFKYYAKFNSNNVKYQFWIQNNHPIELESPKWIGQKVEYIHMNPVQAEIVDEAKHYKYSSARNYLGQQGLIDVELLELNSGPGNIML